MIKMPLIVAGSLFALGIFCVLLVLLAFVLSYYVAIVQKNMPVGEWVKVDGIVAFGVPKLFAGLIMTLMVAQGTANVRHVKSVGRRDRVQLDWYEYRLPAPAQ